MRLRICKIKFYQWSLSFASGSTSLSPSKQSFKKLLDISISQLNGFFEDEVMEIKTEEGYKNIPIEFMTIDENTEEEYEDENLREVRFWLNRQPLYNLETKEEKYKIGKLNKEQEEKFKALIKKYEEIFAKDSKDLGRTNLAKHTIDTGDHKPF